MNFDDFDLNLLVVFEAVYSAKSISKAAEILNISQPAVSNSLNRLRAKMDDKLFTRAGSGMQPTAKSEEMIESVRAALVLVKSSLATKKDAFDPNTADRTFRMIVAVPIEGMILPALCNQIAGNDIKLELMPASNWKIEEGLTSSKFDLSLFLMPSPADGIVYEHLVTSELMVVARKGHPRIQGSINKEQYIAEEKVTMRLGEGKLPNSGRITAWKQVEKQSKVQVSSLGVLMRLVATTDLICLVPKIYAESQAKTMGLQVMPSPIVPMSLQFFMAWHQRNNADPGHKWLREQVKTIVANAGF